MQRIPDFVPGMSRLVNKTGFPVLFTNLDRRMTLLLIPGPRSDFTFDKSSIMVTVGEAIALLSKYDRDQQIKAIADHDIVLCFHIISNAITDELCRLLTDFFPCVGDPRGQA